MLHWIYRRWMIWRHNVDPARDETERAREMRRCRARDWVVHFDPPSKWPEPLVNWVVSELVRLIVVRIRR